jgi:exosortase/archaeosortase family protein
MGRKNAAKRERRREERPSVPRSPARAGGSEDDRARRRSTIRFVLVLLVLLLVLFVGYHYRYAPENPMNRVLTGYLRVYAHVAGGLLNVCGANVEVVDRTIQGRTAVEVAAGCDAMEAKALFIAAVLAFPVAWRRKLIGIAIGLPILMVVNLIRIVSLYYIHLHWPESFEFAHMTVWQFAFIALAAGMWIRWAAWATKPSATAEAASASEPEEPETKEPAKSKSRWQMVRTGRIARFALGVVGIFAGLNLLLAWQSDWAVQNFCDLVNDTVGTFTYGGSGEVMCVPPAEGDQADSAGGESSYWGAYLWVGNSATRSGLRATASPWNLLYFSLTLFVALQVLTPLPPSKRVLRGPLGLLILGGLIGGRWLISVVALFVGTEPHAVYAWSPFWQNAVLIARQAFVDPAGNAYLIALVAWATVSFRLRDWIEAAPDGKKTPAQAAPNKA